MKTPIKPALFVGSSSESLDVAYAAQKNLEDVAEVVVWKQGIFELTKSYLESLLDAEQKHLLNIAGGKTKGYRGGSRVRSELRHLRSIGLIRKHADRHIAELKSDSVHDLSDS
jgi:predicted nucleotide-binding protein